ncbi:hypothetical protein A3860_18605 [Niastella vici]|uniref:Rho-GAP domain-containing protein n=1 Tax=Niastella vici TaxID=1703345 RepID=A0A1V9G2G9_9BACT|nr:hypothetical protein [Niastella vici]OQP64770.1 hypothetical protein A3860_18605 [Niastella vici]
MSKSTKALIKGIKKMLKNRGSLTVKEVKLLSDVVVHLESHEKLNGEQKVQNGALVVQLLLRFLTDPTIGEGLSHLVHSLIDKLV